MNKRDTDTGDLFGDDELDHASIIAHLDSMEADDPHRWPQRLIELTDVIAATLGAKHDIDAERAKRMARTLAAGIARYFGGQGFYLPACKKLDLMLRDKAIWDSFKGRNHKELAQRYKLTVVQIYNIVKYQRQLHQRKIQHTLFE